MTVKAPLGEARLVTMRELSQHTAQVIAEINDRDEPALVTRHGRFQAIIWPLANKKVESLVLAHLGDLVSGLADFDQESEASVYSTKEAAHELGLPRSEGHEDSR
jgi:antitoxin (DNA-binding transcriptional repressor) of toxin-antitoxin stability system